jgi:tRNA(fMet)-specific endonuclease VapC
LSSNCELLSSKPHYAARKQLKWLKSLLELITDPCTTADHIARVGEDSLCLSIVTAAELRCGAAKSGSSRLLERVEAVLARVPVLPLDVPADAEYGGIRAELEATGQSIGPNGLLIAAHAQALGATIVTADVAEFRRVRGLAVENWIA